MNPSCCWQIGFMTLSKGFFISTCLQALKPSAEVLPDRYDSNDNLKLVICD